MAADGFRVAPEELARHALRLRQAADIVATAKGADQAATTRLGGQP